MITFEKLQSSFCLWVSTYFKVCPLLFCASSKEKESLGIKILTLIDDTQVKQKISTVQPTFSKSLIIDSKLIRNGRKKFGYQSLRNAQVKKNTQFLKLEKIQKGQETVQVEIQTDAKEEKIFEVSIKTKYISINDSSLKTLSSDSETEKFEKVCILIQKYFRGYLAKKKFKNTVKAAILIQKVWRGYQVRKFYLRDDYFLKVYKKIKISNKNATQQMTMGVRTSNAFQRIFFHKNFHNLICELKTLELTTRMSPESSITIASERTVKILLEEIINKSNRSEPNQLIIYYSFGILINLIKFKKTSFYVQSCKSLVETCLKFSKVYYRSEKILNKCLTLLYILITCDSNPKAIINHPTFILNWKRFLKLNRFIYIKPKRSFKSLKFYPEWCIANNIEYEFTKKDKAIQAICSLYF